MAEQGKQNAFVNFGELMDRSRYGGVPANAFLVPIIVLLAALHITVVALIFSINTTSEALSKTMQETSVYVTDATSLLAGSSLLSETSSNYVLLPVTAQGEPNVAPLKAYVNELAQTDHRGDAIEARFENYEVSEEVRQNIHAAAHAADALIDTQLHAFALVNAVYPMPDNPALTALELPDLSPEESALPNEAKLELAQNIMLDTNYGSDKNAVSINVNEGVGRIRAASGASAEAASDQVKYLRAMLWATTVVIIVVLCITFVSLYRQIISPLDKYAWLIVNDNPLDEKRGLREMRLLAGSYNSLLHRRNDLEAILREAAETDTLTGLPNRYNFQQRVLEIDGSDLEVMVAIFDVDNLKITNDTLGHGAGDDLLRRAAYCISTCFTSGDGGSCCYRIGGDEFVAVMTGVGEQQIASIGDAFKEVQERNDVSISWGYAHADAAAGIPFKELMDEADQRMYKMKQEAHARSGKLDERPIQ